MNRIRLAAVLALLGAFTIPVFARPPGVANRKVPDAELRKTCQNKFDTLEIAFKASEARVRSILSNIPKEMASSELDALLAAISRGSEIQSAALEVNAKRRFLLEGLNEEQAARAATIYATSPFAERSRLRAIRAVLGPQIMPQDLIALREKRDPSLAEREEDNALKETKEVLLAIEEITRKWMDFETTRHWRKRVNDLELEGRTLRLNPADPGSDDHDYFFSWEEKMDRLLRFRFSLGGPDEHLRMESDLTHPADLRLAPSKPSHPAHPTLQQLILAELPPECAKALQASSLGSVR